MNLKRHFSPPQYFHYFDSELFEYPLSVLGQNGSIGASKSNFRGIYPLNDAVTSTHATSFRSYEHKPPSFISFPQVISVYPPFFLFHLSAQSKRRRFISSD